jgi:hypothetical protein
MSEKFAPQRRKLLALESERPPETGLIVHPHRQRAAGQVHETALSIPESVRALGEPLEPFFDACGGRQTISLAVRRSGSRSPPETFAFQQPFVLVGRCRESDLFLDDPGVNFRHLYLQLVAGQWMFFDLRMIAGGAADDEQRSPWGRFDCHDELRVGPCTIGHVGSQALLSAPAAGQAGDAVHQGLPGVDLEFVTGDGKSRQDERWRIDRAVSLVGASRQCDLWLRDESVSKVHASLVLTPYGLWVVDLIGRGSVLVNGRPAYWKQLHDGSLLQIGRYRFRARFDAPAKLPAREISGRIAPEILPTADYQAPHAGLIDPTVAALLGQMVAMQNQFFEHSQNQMQMMGELLAQLGRSQQASVRQDMERIDAITRELEQLKLQLSGERAQSPVLEPRKRAGAPDDMGRRRSTDSAGEISLPVSPVPDPAALSQPAPGRRVSQGEVAVEQPAARHTSELGAAPPAAAEAHKRLTERMARLAQERNAGWLRILDVFSRKQQGRQDE